MVQGIKNIISKVGILVGLFLFIIVTCKNYTKERNLIDTPRERVSDYPIQKEFIERRSYRAMSAEAITDDQLFSLFEASRWAPSSFNDQPWKFVYAHRDTPAWDALFDTLVDFNKSWAKDAAALIMVISRNVFDTNSNAGRNGLGNQPSMSHSFDTGAAWMSMALQGHAMDLVVHAMTGFDMVKAIKVINLPEDHTIEALIAVGKPGPVTRLPGYLQEGESAPSLRKPITEFIHEGSF